MNKNTYFTSEAVSPGHPDKVADIISDAVLAYYLTVAPEARVACETFVVGKKVILGGEVNVSKITPLTPKDYKTIIADCLKSIGYTPEVYPEFNYDNFDLEVLIQNQSSEINNAVDKVTDIAAGDQGIMFGWANNNKETNYLGAEHYYALKLMKVLNAEVKSNKNNILRPDAKSQITGKYDSNGKLVSFDTILVSHQHKPDYFDAAFDLINSTIKSVIPEKLIDNDTKIIINPSGAFTIGGPIGDTGLTGRKIIVDTYGGKARHGGGAFCFHPDTLVKTIDGYTKISDIEVGTLVWTKNEHNEYLKLKPVNQVFEKSAEDSYDLLEVELENGEVIRITEQHEVMTSRGWVIARDLTEDDNIIEFKDLKIPFSNNTIEYWINKGYSLNNAIDEVSLEQRKRSPRCTEYWLKHGFDIDESILKVSEYQSQFLPSSIKYWINKGFSIEEAAINLSNFQSKTRSNFTEYDWEMYKLTNGHSLEAYIYREGPISGPISYKSRNDKLSESWKLIFEDMSDEDRKSLRGRPGPQNGMYKRTPPHASGSGISGYYKDYLFRSLLELEAILHLEDHNFNFTTNEVRISNEPLLKFELEGSDTYYVPDLLIFNDKGDVIKIIEVKPNEFIEDFESYVLPRLLPNLGTIIFEKLISYKDLNYNYSRYLSMYKNHEIIIHDSKLERFLKLGDRL